VIKNKTHYPSRRLTLTFGLGPGCDLAAAHTALLAAVARVPGVLPAPPPVVAFQGWEQEGVRTNVQFWIEMNSDGPTMETAVTQAILEESRRSGLELRSTGQSIVLRQAAG
jgi:small-conductance mechanosensitive channel